jgi:hypothetical protein
MGKTPSGPSTQSQAQAQFSRLYFGLVATRFRLGALHHTAARGQQTKPNAQAQSSPKRDQPFNLYL